MLLKGLKWRFQTDDTEMLQKMDVLHEEITPYSEYRIVKRGPRIDMEVRGAVFAVYHPQHLLSGYSWDALTAAAALSPYKRVRRILMLGVAAGTALRQMRWLWPKAEIVGVDIDEKLVKAAERFMGLHEVAANLIYDDADNALASLEGPFDVIVDDLYRCGDDDVERGGRPFPQRLACLKKMLSPKGLLVANFINDIGFEIPLEQGETAFKNSFAQVACIHATYGLNQVYVGGSHLQGPEQLQEMAQKWSESHDRSLWRSIRVLGLQNYD